MTSREFGLMALGASATMGILNTFNYENFKRRCLKFGLTEREALQAWDIIKPIIYEHADDLIDAQEAETGDYRAIAVYHDAASF